MNKFVLLACLASAAIASPAMAQDAPAMSHGWVGLVVGAQHGDLIAKNGEKPLYGLNAGYDFSFGKLRAGVEAEGSDSKSKACAKNVERTGDRLCVKTGRDLYAGA